MGLDSQSGLRCFRIVARHARVQRCQLFGSRFSANARVSPSSASVEIKRLEDLRQQKKVLQQQFLGASRSRPEVGRRLQDQIVKVRTEKECSIVTRNHNYNLWAGSLHYTTIWNLEAPRTEQQCKMALLISRLGTSKVDIGCCDVRFPNSHPYSWNPQSE